MTPRPKTGAWIVPANEARGAFVSTENGPTPLVDLVDKRLLRPDQILKKCYYRTQFKRNRYV